MCGIFIDYWLDANDEYLYLEIECGPDSVTYKINIMSGEGFKLNSSYDINTESVKYEIDCEAATFNVKIDAHLAIREQLESILKQILTLK